jgi:hypothetical protein
MYKITSVLKSQSNHSKSGKLISTSNKYWNDFYILKYPQKFQQLPT